MRRLFLLPLLLSAATASAAVTGTVVAADGRFSIDAKGNATIDIVVDAAGREPAALYAADGDDAGAVSLSTANKARRVRVVADGKPVANALLYLGHSLLVRSDTQGNAVRTSTGEPGFIVHPDYGAG